MSNSTVRYVLQNVLKGYAEGKGIPVAWQGVKFTKPTTGVWLEAFLLPAKTIDSVLDARRATYVGTFQVNVWALTGTGVKQAETVSEEIVSLFDILSEFDSVMIDQTPSVEKAIPDTTGWFFIPISIRYRLESWRN